LPPLPKYPNRKPKIKFQIHRTLSSIPPHGFKKKTTILLNQNPWASNPQNP
jgi:hypothetical protein